MKRLLFFVLITVGTISSCKKDNTILGPSVSSNSFLSDQDYTKLRIEIQSVPNHEPTAQTLNNLVSFLKDRLKKPGGIEIVQTSISSPGKTTLDLDQIRTIEKESRTLFSSGNTLTAYILFLDAEYAQNNGSSKVLGIAYGSSSMVLFEKTIEDNSGGLAQPSQTVLETVVAEHEFGHVMGLVNNGTPMLSAHQDKPHGAHCDNSSCLMYWSVETTDILGNLLGGKIPSLDQNCINDLRVNGGL